MAATRNMDIELWSYEQDHKDMAPMLKMPNIGIAEAGDLMPNFFNINDPEKKDVKRLTSNKNLAYTDPWGKPYLIAWQKNNYINSGASNGNQGYSFLVWSCGPNQLNEFGQGDDIYSLNGEPMNVSKIDSQHLKRSLSLFHSMY